MKETKTICNTKKGEKKYRTYKFIISADTIRCDLCGKLYANASSFNDHIIECKKDHPITNNVIKENDV